VQGWRRRPERRTAGNPGRAARGTRIRLRRLRSAVEGWCAICGQESAAVCESPKCRMCRSGSHPESRDRAARKNGTSTRALDGVLGRRGERLVDAIGSLGALLGGYPRGSILRSAPPGGRQRKRRREREQDQRGGSPSRPTVISSSPAPAVGYCGGTVDSGPWQSCRTEVHPPGGPRWAWCG